MIRRFILSIKEMKIPALRTEIITLLTSVLFTLFCNNRFWSELSALRDFSQPQGWLLLLAIAVLLTGLHWFILLLLCNRWTTKPVLSAIIILTLSAVYFMGTYQIYLDRPMIRNIFETDFKEATELLNWKLLPVLVLSGGIVWLVSRLKILRSSLRQALAWRSASLVAALAMVGIGIWPVMNQMLPLLRYHKELRYLVTPSNFIVSSIRVAREEFSSPGKEQPREILDPSPSQSLHAATRKPVAVVLVVGETVRAANWGLNGYARQTTPLLAEQDVINFSHVTSSGTDTATALPAMFSINGRHDYDRKEITRRESLLHLLDRAGVNILWRDNQSGDKKVDQGLPYEDMSAIGNPDLKNGNRYFDEILLEDLESRIASMDGDSLIVLHMLGNHGPAYFKRYPESFRKWTPTCDSADLSASTHEAIENTYDNSILYTDYVLSQAINILASITTHDTALLYVSDHGESLGEDGLYLHGLPMWVAPDTQTHVPMFMWFSPEFADTQDLDLACLRAKADEPVSHDYIFHTLIDLLDVQSRVYEPEWDLLQDCRTQMEFASTQSGGVDHPDKEQGG